MLRSSANLAADDVTITCRVRRSKYAVNPDFDDVQEMTCTMRYWHQTEASPTRESDWAPSHDRTRSNPSVMQLLVGDSEQHDPELVLCPVQSQIAGMYDGGPIKLSERFESFGSQVSLGSHMGSNPSSRHPSVSRSRPPSAPRSRNPSRAKSRNPSRQRGRNPSRGRMIWSAEELNEVPPPQVSERFPVEKKQESFVIPLSDIVVVDVYSSDAPTSDGIFRSHDRLTVTTLTNGFFEFFFDSRMSYDILLAFLKANLPDERVTDGVASPLAREIRPNVSSCCSQDMFDAETLTARRMEERVEKERFAERVRRKITHFATRVGELSNEIADCACGCEIAPEDDSKRQSPPHHFEFPEDLEFSSSHRHLEMSDSNMQYTPVTAVAKNKKPKKKKKPHTGFPDGISFEDDVPEVEKISFEDE